MSDNLPPRDELKMIEQHFPGREERAMAWNEGREAAANGRHFRTDCPHTYDKCIGMSYDEFNATKRPLMDEWFKGWKQFRDGNSRRDTCGQG